MSLRLAEVQSQTDWDSFILSHSPYALFQSWLWGDVQKRAGQSVYRFRLMDGETLVGTAQIFVVKAKRGTFLHVRHGPVFRQQRKQLWQDFFTALKPIVHSERAWFVRVSPMIESTAENKELVNELGLAPAPIHEVDAERCWVLDLNRTPEDILKDMRKTTRYEIRQGEKLGVQVRMSSDPEELKHFYRLYKETSKRHGFVAHTSITEEFELFARDGKAQLFLGYAGSELMASAIILFWGRQAIYHHGASLFSKIPVSYFVQWQAILEAKKRGMKLYNFYGIAPENSPNHPWRGITLFKKGFGGYEVNFIHAHDLPVSKWYILPKTVETVRRKLRGY